jgi:hypothetical protein
MRLNPEERKKLAAWWRIAGRGHSEPF